MAVAVQLDFRGVTLEQYDEFSELTGYLPGGPAPPGALFHWITETDDGFRITDVWESRDAFEAFAEEMIAPHFREVGVNNPPEVQFFEVHNYLVGSRWRG
jgi:hypothetical protein